MDDLVQEISKRPGPKWPALITRLKFMTPHGRFQIESRHDHFKEKQSVMYHRMCCMDCITQWLNSGNNQKLNDREKKLKLFTEMYKIADFRGFVKEFADAEGIALPLEAGLDQSALAVARSKPSSPAVAESSPDFRIDVNNTTRSITYEAPPQTQGTLAVTAKGGNVSPILSLAGPPMVMSYGDNLTSNEGMSLATTDGAGGINVLGVPQVYATPRLNGASVGVDRHDQSVIRGQGRWPADMGRADMGGVSRPSSRPRGSFEAPEESSVGSSGTHGSSSLSAGVLGDAESTTSHYTTSEGDYSDDMADNLNTLTPESVLQGDIYLSRIDVTIKKHKFAILDVSQRLSSAKWRDIGGRLGMERSFIDQLEREEEEMDERFYAMIMKWLENGAGHRTFNDLRDLIKAEELDALLVMEERLEGEEGVEVLVKAIQRDLLIECDDRA